MSALACLCLVLGAATSAVVPPSPLDFGNYSLTIVTKSAAAQRFFDHGLLHAFGFNFPEARRAFQSCESADPAAAMCSWGLAHANGPTLNHVILSAAEVATGQQAAVAAVKKSKGQLAPSSKQASLVAAMPLQFPSTGINQSAAFDAYAAALMQTVQLFPRDADVLSFAAAAQMNLCRLHHGGYYLKQTMAGPSGGWLPCAARAKLMLEAALLEGSSSNPSHPFALHLYVHLTEPGNPGTAAGAGLGQAAADELAVLNIRGIGHLQHMPGHLYLRMGRYNDAINSNLRAGASDAAYVSDGLKAYGPAHNAAFGSYAAAMDGQAAVAVQFAGKMRGHYLNGSEINDGSPPMEVGWNLILAHRARFAQWNPLLADNSHVPDGGRWPYAAVLRHYCLAMAYASTSNRTGMQWEQQQLQRLLPQMGTSQAPLAAVANLSVAARAAALDSDWGEAAQLLGKAAASQVAWRYTEPPDWHYPIRQCWAAALLAAGRPTEAEAVFRADLQQYLRNGWSLLGLSQTMAAQPNKYSTAQVQQVQAQFRVAWQRADVQIKSACPMFEGDGMESLERYGSAPVGGWQKEML